MLHGYVYHRRNRRRRQRQGHLRRPHRHRRFC